MGKLQDFLMQQEVGGAETSEVDIAPFPFPFVIKAISEGEHKQIRKASQQVTFDKRTRQRKSETDNDKYQNALVSACCVEPNLKDAALQEKYGVRGAEALVDALFNPGQFNELLLAIMEFNGFADDMNELTEQAKNSYAMESEQTMTE